MPPQIAVLTGPTATGKTNLSIALAHDIGAEIVSADSMQVYIGMDIGTAKPTLDEMEGIPHHMLSIISPGNRYSVAMYVEQALHCVDGIIARGKLPLIVGGTGLYIDSLIAGRRFASPVGDGEIRERLSHEYDILGGETLYNRLKAVDPERAEKLHFSDRKRIIRALEVYEATGTTISRHDRESKLKPPRYDARILALDYDDRQLLYKRIDNRVDEMISDGFESEVKDLIDAGIDRAGTAMQAIGYKELALAIEGGITREEATVRIKTESRRYAKRQLTWLRGKENITWLRWGSDIDFNRARAFSTEFFGFYL